MFYKLLSPINYSLNIDNVLYRGKCLKGKIIASITMLYIFPVQKGNKRKKQKGIEKNYRNGIFALLRFQFEIKKKITESAV